MVVIVLRIGVVLTLDAQSGEQVGELVWLFNNGKVPSVKEVPRCTDALASVDYRSRETETSGALAGRVCPASRVANR